MDKLTSQYLRVIKQLLFFSQTTPNVALMMSHMYNVNTITKINTISHILILLNVLNYGSVLSKVAFIRLKKFQIKNCIPFNILVEPFTTKINIKNNLLTQILAETRREGLLVDSLDYNRKFVVRGEKISLEAAIDDEKIYRQLTILLQKCNLIFIDQIIYHINGKLISYLIICNINNVPQPNTSMIQVHKIKHKG